MKRKILVTPCVLGGLFLLLFCSKPVLIRPAVGFDTPEHHAAVGKRLLERGSIEDAILAFERAVELDPSYAPAYVGLAMAEAIRKDYEKSLEHLKKAKDVASTKQIMAEVHLGYMKVYTMGTDAIDEDWLDSIEDHYGDVIKAKPDCSESYYFMGLAYKKALMFREAADQFFTVLEIGSAFTEEADREYALVQKIERAMPGTRVGRQIALIPGLSRADVAAIFIEELSVDRILAKREKKSSRTAFKSPESNFKTGKYVSAPEVTDISRHALKNDVEIILEIGIRGLEPFPDHTFQPDRKVSRAEFAMMLEDILVRVKGDEKLAVRYIGDRSPFPDLRNDLPYFNAVMVCTMHGLMEPGDPVVGEFDAMGIISGADAMLSVRALKSRF